MAAASVAISRWWSRKSNGKRSAKSCDGKAERADHLFLRNT